MDWIEVFVETTKAGLEPVSGFLYSAGLTGLVITDEDEFGEFLNDPNRDWDYIDDGLAGQKPGFGIGFYLRDDPAGREDLEFIRSGLANIKQREPEYGSLAVTLKNVREEDWANNWKKYFKPFHVGKSLVIKPSWEDYAPADGEIVLEIDPGNVFGSGIHETTKMCMEAMEGRIAPGMKVLDIGSGSGILSVAALLFGADKAYALDIDKNAAPVARANAEKNHIAPERLAAETGDILTDAVLWDKYGGKGFDAVFANIVADIVIALSEKVPAFLRDGGLFISSGIIDDRIEDVLSALPRNGFEIIEVKEQGSWRAVVAKLG